MQTRTALRSGVLFLTMIFAASTVLAQDAQSDLAQNYLKKNAKALGLTQSDLQGWIVTDQYVTKHNGVTHIYIQQRHDNIPVFGAQLNLAIAKDGSVLSTANRFIPDVKKVIRSSARSLDPQGAVQAVARKHGLEVSGALIPEPARGRSAAKPKSDHDVVLSTGGIASEPISVELVYFPMENGDVRLAWATSLYTMDGAHYYLTMVDAASGEILSEHDLVLQDNWSSESDGGEQRLFTQLRDQVARMPLIPYALPETFVASPPVDGASYRVYPSPFESPSHAGDPNLDLRQLVTNPADPTASPLGWHSDGTNSYTRTRGNNVHAYTDLNADNIADPGSDPDGGAGLVFDFPFDPGQGPETYRPAAVTNLFYWNNNIHDVLYRYGFDEASGNFQVNNFGNGGLGSDDVRAEAQDGSGTNNANFGTPVDGFRPRMQMFVWTARALVTVNGGPIAGDYAAGPAAFGPTLTTTGTTGDVELANDGAGASTSDACEPLVGFTAGKIALLDRGGCTFVTKVTNAQDAGAIGVVVANNVPGGGVITMGGAGPIVIPSAMISFEAGLLFKANLPVNVTLKRVGQDRDSDFDNGVIVHEYGHGVSNRLTGGPGTVSCLNNAEQMGEGWSDYYAIMLTGNGENNRGIGTYVIFEPTTGTGIRPWPYSTSMSTNPSTYDTIKDAANISQPHGIGAVWATMLWDMTSDLIGRYGYDANIASGSGGNNVGLRLVTDGLKLQACQPGFVDGRNAILAADAASGGANECLIWDSFARRGLGYSADQGSPFLRLDGTEAFDLPVSCCTFATLTAKVNALKTGGTLNAGQTKSLLKKLQNAQQQANAGKAAPAIDMLMSFISEVADLGIKPILSAQQVQELTDCANGIINRIRQDFPTVAAKFAGETSAMMSLSMVEGVPVEFALSQSYPNPFSRSTEIRVALPEASQVRLAVYDIMGHEVARLADGAFAAGYHDFTLDGNRLASGVYFYRVDAGSFVDVKRVVLVK